MGCFAYEQVDFLNELRPFVTRKAVSLSSNSSTTMNVRESLQENYGYLFEEALIEEILAVGRAQELKHGETIIDYGQQVKNMPLLLNGAIKIMRQDSEGEELLLYFLESGDTCTMTMTCCLGNTWGLLTYQSSSSEIS